MPKRIWKIDKFHGGLNSNADPRDIEDNELSDASDIMVDQVGKIRALGGMAAHYNYGKSASTPAAAGTVRGGYGLFHFSHDRLGGHLPIEHLADGDTMSSSTWDYTNDWASGSGQAEYEHSSGTGTLIQTAVKRSVEGLPATKYSLTYTVENFSNSNITSFRIKGTGSEFSDDNVALEESDGTHTTTFTSHATDPDQPLTIQCTSNGESSFDLTDVSLYITDETGDDYLAFADTDGSANLDIYSKVDNTWGGSVVDLGSTTGMLPSFYYVDGALRVSDGAFGVANENMWYGVINRILFPGTASQVINNGWFSLAQALTKPGSGCSILTNGNNPAPDPGDIDIAFFNDNGSGGTWDLVSYDGIRCYVSFVYDGDVGDRTGQETLLREMSTSHDAVAKDQMMKLRIVADPPYNARITGGRIYWSEIIDKDTGDVETYEIDGTRYLLAEFDFNRGSRPAGDNQWIKWDEAAVSGDVETPDGTFHQILHPPMDETYESINGFSHNYDSISFDADGYGFKTAVVANRVVYAGNVRMKNKDGIVETRADAMFKSLVGKFDTFVPDRLIEASIRDGDEIVKLEEYADRVLQFKKKKMHLINVSQEIEFLEDTFMHKGVNHPAATCKTDYGIAWVNRHGVFLYDGKRVNNLLEKDGRQVISDVSWDDWITAAGGSPMIGYVPKKRQLIVIADQYATGGDNDIYLHDLVTRSWVHGTNRVPATDVAKTNPITDWNGDFVVGHTTGTLVKWEDALVDATVSLDAAVYIKTKDIDFGQPAQRKKVYRVRISYKGDADGLYVRYLVNGETDTYRSFEGTTLSGGIATPDGSEDTTPLEDATDLSHWTHAELKPSTSSEANNIYSFRLAMWGSIDDDFEVNDISIVYRLKPAN
jgi:hypothetical protein